MNPKNEYAEIGMRSLNRVALKVYEDARQKNSPLPVWVDGKIEYIIPSQTQIDELTKKVNETNQSSSQSM